MKVYQCSACGLAIGMEQTYLTEEGEPLCRECHDGYQMHRATVYENRECMEVVE